MIYPRLNRVRNGQRLSVELVNGLIKRTEYAGDLLRQGKCLAGADISVAQRFDGTTIAGGAIRIYTIPWNTRDDFLNGQLFPVSLAGTSFPPSAWSSLLSLYAVWVTPGAGFAAAGGVDHIFEYSINFDETTLYKISSSGDDKCTVFLDGTQVLISTGPGTIVSTTIQITAGLHKIKTVGFNNIPPSPLWTLNPGGWAVLIDYA